MNRDDDLIFGTLTRHQVPYVIIGGHAVNFHGHIRLTEDTDIIWRRTPESELALLNALTELNAKWLGNQIDPATGIEKEYPVSLPYIRSTHLMMVWTANGFLDIFDHMPSRPADDIEPIFQTSVTDGRFQYASREWLVHLKQIAGRAKDLEDLKNLPES
jgi:hypothetical protein